jgi:hypothetical protein
MFSDQIEQVTRSSPANDRLDPALLATNRALRNLLDTLADALDDGDWERHNDIIRVEVEGLSPRCSTAPPTTSRQSSRPFRQRLRPWRTTNVIWSRCMTSIQMTKGCSRGVWIAANRS